MARIKSEAVANQTLGGYWGRFGTFNCPCSSTEGIFDSNLSRRRGYQLRKPVVTPQSFQPKQALLVGCGQPSPLPRTIANVYQPTPPFAAGPPSQS